jgi:DNA modification methylase
MKYPYDFINKIIHGDCLEIMKNIPDKSVDLVLTDPPYNCKSIGTKNRVYEQQKMQLPIQEYIEFCKSWFKEVERISDRIVFTPGISNICYYPQPFWVICWYKPAAVSFNRMGGFNAWEPIFVYGKPTQRLGQDVLKFNTINFKKGPESKHPCPKPKDLWKHILLKFSNENDIIFDPFIGSGTTAYVCKQESRRFIGIEKEKKYCEIAERRLSQEYFIFS